MALDERPYYRDPGYSTNRFTAILSGSLHLFTAFGIRVRIHSALIFLIVCQIILNWGTPGFELPIRLFAMGLLFGIILLHEYGHCFAARIVGGSASEILLWPLGGLAYPDVPERPAPNFWTVAGGPLVNVLICAFTGIAFLFLIGQSVQFDPLHNFARPDLIRFGPAFFCWWTYRLSYSLLLLNLLPIYPLDGGQMLQTILWHYIGRRRSMMISCMIGMTASVALGIIGLVDHFNLFLIILAAWLFFSCYQMRVRLHEEGAFEPWQSDEADYSTSLYRNPATGRRPVSKKTLRLARKRARQEAAERQHIDAILAKVSSHGMSSLTWRERRALRKTTEKLRQSELEMKELLGE